MSFHSAHRRPRVSIRWGRIALASATPVLLIIGLYIAIGVRNGHIERQVLLDVFVPLAAQVIAVGSIAAAFLWGTIKIAFRHPAFDADYQAWLATTPWRAGMPLPRGAVRLELRDALLAVGLTATASAALVWDEKIFWRVGLAPLLAMPLGAAIACLFDNWRTGQQRHTYAALLTTSVIGLVAPLWLTSIALPIATYFIGIAGVESALREFPWSEPEERPTGLGWPYSMLLAEPPEVRTSAGEAALRALVLATAILSLGANITISADEADSIVGVTMMWCGLGTAMLGLHRCANFSPVICPSLCWGERVGTGRWIVPSHDVVFALPALIALIGPASVYLLTTFLGVPIHFTAAIGMGLATFLTFGVGPTVAELQYTGKHAIAFRTVGGSHDKRANYVEVTA